MVSAVKLREQLADLPVAERAELARYLIDSLDETVDADAQAQWTQEIQRRLSDIQQGLVTGQRSEQVMESLLRKFQ